MKILPVETPAGPRFDLRWYWEGKKIRKRFRTEKEARKFVRETKSESAGIAASIRALTRDQQADIIAALQGARRLGLTVLECVRDVASRRARVTTAGVTLGEAQTAFLVRCESERLRPHTVDAYRIVLRAFVVDAGLPAIETTRSEVESFLGRFPNPATRNWYFRHLRAWWSWMVETGQVGGSPMDGMKPARVDQSSPMVLTVPECRRLLVSAREFGCLPYVAIGLFAGVRPVTLRRLTWSAVDRAQGVITVPGSSNKTRDRYHATIQPALAAWLDSADSGPLIPPGLRHRMDRTRQAADVPWCADILRHSFASYHLTAFQDPGKTAFELGHRGNPDMLWRHYRSLVTADSAREFWSILPA